MIKLKQFKCVSIKCQLGTRTFRPMEIVNKLVTFCAAASIRQAYVI